MVMPVTSPERTSSVGAALASGNNLLPRIDWVGRHVELA